MFILGSCFLLSVCYSEEVVASALVYLHAQSRKDNTNKLKLSFKITDFIIFKVIT